MTNQNHGSAEGAKEKVQAVAGDARQEAGQVADTARDAAGELAGTAREEVGHVRDEAMQQVRGLTDTAATQLREQAGTQKDRAAQQARTVTDDLQRVARGEQAQSDLVSGAISAVAQQAERLTHRLETAEPAELLDDVRSFAARRPGTFLALALGAGLVAGRLTRGLRDVGQGADRGARQYLPSEHREHMQERTLNPPAHAADDPTAPSGDVAPHHIQSQAPAYGGTPASAPGMTPGRHAQGAPAQTGQGNPNAQAHITESPAEQPFDQENPGGRA